MIWVLVGSLVAVGAAGIGSAHETTLVQGYQVTFGGSDEPVITDERMWLQVEILDAETGFPVTGIGDSVDMAVQRPFGNDSHALDVHRVHGRPGWYEGAIVFTTPGTYTVVVTAEINGTTIETEFSKQVHNASALTYPSPRPSRGGGMELTGPVGFGVGAIVATLGSIVAFLIGRRRVP